MYVHFKLSVFQLQYHLRGTKDICSFSSVLWCICMCSGAECSALLLFYTVVIMLLAQTSSKLGGELIMYSYSVIFKAFALSRNLCIGKGKTCIGSYIFYALSTGTLLFPASAEMTDWEARRATFLSLSFSTACWYFLRWPLNYWSFCSTALVTPLYWSKLF